MCLDYRHEESSVKIIKLSVEWNFAFLYYYFNSIYQKRKNNENDFSVEM